MVPLNLIPNGSSMYCAIALFAAKAASPEARRYSPDSPFVSILIVVLKPYPRFSVSGRFLAEIPETADWRASMSEPIPAVRGFSE